MLSFLKRNLRIPLFLANVAICEVGSEPIDKMQTKGVLGSDSSHVASKSRICISPYSGPSDSSMYFLACDIVRSGLQERISSNLRKLSNVVLYEQGISSASGFSDSYHVFHSFSLDSIYSEERLDKIYIFTPKHII